MKHAFHQPGSVSHASLHHSGPQRQSTRAPVEASLSDTPGNQPRLSNLAMQDHLREFLGRPGVQVGETCAPAERRADALAERALYEQRVSPSDADASRAAGATLPGLSGGHALNSGLMAAFKPALGPSVHQVRLHHDQRAADWAAGLNARAFAYGNNVVFGTGQYRPHNRDGQHLLAHELAHVARGETGVIRRDPGDGLNPLTQVWVNSNTGVYHPPGSRFYGQTQQGEYMTAAEADAGGYRQAGSGLSTNATSGVYRVQRPPRGASRIVIDSWLGPGQARQGFERQMASAAEYGLEEIEGWERAHSQGAGIGAESAEGIRLAPRVVNQAMQNQGIERFMRELEAAKPEGTRIHLRTVTKTHPGTLRLSEIDYEISVQMPGERSQRTVMRASIEVQSDGTARGGAAFAGTDQIEWGEWQRPPARNPDVDIAPTTGGTPRGTSAGGQPSGVRAGTPRPTFRGRMRNLHTRFRGFHGRGGMRSVGGRGIGVLISLAAGFLIGQLEASRHSRHQQAAVRNLEARVERKAAGMANAAIALHCRNPGNALYLNVTYTYTETEWITPGGWGMEPEVNTDFDGITLDHVGLSRSNVNDTSYSSSGSVFGSGIHNHETLTVSMPVEVAEIPSLADLQIYQRRLGDIDLAFLTQTERQLLAQESRVLLSAIGAYQAAVESGTDIDSLNAVGARIVNDLEKLGDWQELQDRVSAVMAHASADLANLSDEIVEPVNRGRYEEWLMRRQYDALTGITGIEQDMGRRSFTPEQLRREAQTIIAHGETASAAATARAGLPGAQVTMYNTENYIASNQGMSLDVDTYMTVAYRREILDHIRHIEISLMRGELSEREIEKQLAAREALLFELQ